MSTMPESLTSPTSSPSAPQGDLPPVLDPAFTNDSDDQYTTPSSSDGPIGRPTTWAAEALQIVHDFEKFGKEADPSIAFLDATIQATCSEDPPTRLLGLSALLCFRSVTALTLGYREEPAIDIDKGAIFPTAVYHFLRATDASDPSSYRQHGILDIIADVMPNGRECISLFVHRLSNQSLLHAYALHDKSGIPVLIRRARNPDQDGKPVDGEHASRMSEGPFSAGRGEEQGGWKEEDRRKEGVVSGERGHDGGMDVQSECPTLGPELPRKLYRSYSSRLSTSPPSVSSPSFAAQLQHFPACTVSVDISPATAEDSHQGDSYQLTNRVVLDTNPSIKLEKVWVKHEISPSRMEVRSMTTLADVLEDAREYAVSHGSAEGRTLTGGVAADLAIEGRPIAGTGGLVHVPTATGTLRGSFGRSGSRTDERSVSETITRRYRCVDAGHRANRHQRFQLDANPSHPAPQDAWLPVEGFAYPVQAELAETDGPLRDGSAGYQFAAQVKAMYRGQTIHDRFNFMLINRIHVDDISKWDRRQFTCHSGTYVVPPVPEDPYLQSSDRTPGEQLVTVHHMRVSNDSTSQTSHLSAHAVAAGVNFCADWNSAVLVYES